MTLRYEDRIPVGLDWSVCTDGTNNPDIWKAVAANVKAKTESGEPASDRPSRQRLSRAVEVVIIRMYRDELLSSKVIADKLEIQPATVFKVLRRNNVPSRSRSEGMALSRARRG